MNNNNFQRDSQFWQTDRGHREITFLFTHVCPANVCYMFVKWKIFFFQCETRPWFNRIREERKGRGGGEKPSSHITGRYVNGQVAPAYFWTWLFIELVRKMSCHYTDVPQHCRRGNRCVRPSHRFIAELSASRFANWERIVYSRGPDGIFAFCDIEKWPESERRTADGQTEVLGAPRLGIIKSQQ